MSLNIDETINELGPERRQKIEARAGQLILEEIYRRVSVFFAERVREVFASEDTLKAVFASHYPHQPFDRTEHWGSILRRELLNVWLEHGLPVKAPPTPYDQAQVCNALAQQLDFNLFSQVLLNLNPSPLIRYRVNNAEATMGVLRARWETRDPSVFGAAPKMFKVASTELELEYNRDLSTLKALKTIAAQAPSRSFRVSPIGATPALVDNQNLSMLGTGGDAFLDIPDGFNAYYYTWEAPPYLLEDVNGGKFKYPGLSYEFESKSGGEILNHVLFARRLAALLYRSFCSDPVEVLPRMNSVLLVTPAAPYVVREHAATCSEVIAPGVVQLHENRRQTKTLPPVAA